MRGLADRRGAAILCVVVLVVVAGCSAGSQLGGGDGAEPTNVEMADGEELAASGAPDPAEEGVERDASDGEALQPRQRAIIRTGRVELSVEDFDAAEQNLTRTAERYGGFVSDSSVEVTRIDNATRKTGTVVLRVPRENFSAMMEAGEAVGEVESSSVDSEDVTDQLIDLGARLDNLRAERERLRQLYRNATDTEDVLAVERRLSEVQGEIERLEARKEGLERQVALSTIRVTLREPRPDPGPIDVDRWYDTPVGAAFLESVDGVATTLRALVVAGAFALPYLIVFGPVLAVGGYLLRRRRGGTQETGEQETQDEGDNENTSSVNESDSSENGKDDIENDSRGPGTGDDGAGEE